MDVENIDISRFPLKHEVFTRKRELGEELARQRAAMRRAEAAARQRRRSIAAWACSIAAAAATIFAAIFMLKTVNIYTGDTGRQVALPCGSTIDLEAYSHISYKPHLWNITGRNVALDGTAYFAVKKGNSFTVETECGNVSVLGTKFKVSEHNDNMSVECFEGRIEVEPADAETGKVQISAGEAVRVEKGKIKKSTITEEPAPDDTADKAIPEVINYKNEPLLNVVAEMELYFGVEVTGKDICDNVTYSGVFYPGNRDLTLEVVFLSCGIEYAVENNVVTLQKQ